MTFRAVAPHQRSYEQAIAFRAGDVIKFMREDREQPGWFWCIGPDGREGWVYAETFLGGSEGDVLGIRAFDAMELSVDLGDKVEGTELVGGWRFCRTPDNRSGWIPAACLEVL